MAGGLKKIVKDWLIPPGYWSLLAKRNARGSVYKKKFSIASDLAQKLLGETAALKDSCKNRRCFILGAGSSIRQQNLAKLAGETVISVSNTYVHPDFALFKPKFHVIPHIMHGHSENSVSSYIDWFTDMDKGLYDAELFMHINDYHLIHDNQLFQDRQIHWYEHGPWDWDFSTPINMAALPPIWSVSEVAISVALHLGFKSIYLIGMDHDWFNGLFVYFYDEKTQHKVKPDASKIPHVDAEFQMRRHADIFKKYKYFYGIKENIYNANADPDHYLDVFPKVDYDALFN